MNEIEARIRDVALEGLFQDYERDSRGWLLKDEDGEVLAQADVVEARDGECLVVTARAKKYRLTVNVEEI
jgi:hypothetical protein